MTFLFTDIEGSTQRWEACPTMAELVERHFVVLRTAITDRGGEVFATLGDGIAAAFDSAVAAVDAAVAAQRQLGPIGVTARMGLHTGEVERVHGDYRGRPVNRAARIMAVGHGGQILVSDVTASLLRSSATAPLLELEDVGTHSLRDLVEPERLWQVVHPELRRQFPAPRTLRAPPTSLPSHRSSLVGREVDAERVGALVHSEPVVMLTGVGGVGKTRLAVRVAEDLLNRFRSVWYVPLANIADPGDVVDAVALAVGAAGAAGPPIEAILGAVSSTPALLVMDNCEHVIDAATAVIDVLTSACPHLRVLATSREALGIEGEQVVAVHPLELPRAVELFVQRARAGGAAIEALDRAMIEPLCARLDGLPLAIELAAARTAALGVAAICDALDDQSLLRSRRRDVDDRHVTMRATIEWSYDLLDPEQQHLFKWLGVFVGGFELDAVRHVAAQLGVPSATATSHLESLVHKSMVTADALPDGSRFRMLETVRAYARDQLDAHDERAAARCALAEWMTTITGLAVDDPCSAAVERNAIRLEREADNWRESMLVAADQESGELAAELCGPPTDFFLLARHDLADVVRPLLAWCTEPRHRRSVLCALIVSASGGTDPTELQEWADEVAAIDAAEPTGLGGLMRWLATAWRGDFAASVKVCVEAAGDERLARATRDLFVGIAVLDHFSLTDAVDDEHDLLPRALQIAARTDVALTRVTCLLGAAWALVERDPGRAVALVRSAFDHIADVPALTRLTLPGSASRLLSRLDPRVAAHALLEQLAATPTRRSFVDLIPLFYGAALLDRLGRAGDEPVLATVAGHRPVGPASMMDFVDQARRASSHTDPVMLRDLEAAVRQGLADVAA